MPPISDWLAVAVGLGWVMVAVLFLLCVAAFVSGMMLMMSTREPLRGQHIELRVPKLNVTVAAKFTSGALLFVAGLGGALFLLVLHWKVVVPLLFLFGAGGASTQADRSGQKKKRDGSKKRHPDRYV